MGVLNRIHFFNRQSRPVKSRELAPVNCVFQIQTWSLAAEWFINEADDHFSTVLEDTGGAIMKARVFVELKKPVLDPQGLAIQRSVQSMGYKQIEAVRQGKFFDIEIAAKSPEEAKKILNEISSKLLANMVIEDFRVEIFS